MSRLTVLALLVPLALAPAAPAVAEGGLCAHVVVTTPPTDDVTLLTSCVPVWWTPRCTTFADYTPRGFGYAVTACTHA